MKSVLLVIWLSAVATAIDTCGYLVTDPLAANLLHARSSCSVFQQSTTSLCPITTTVTRAASSAITSTVLQTVLVTKTLTANTTLTTTVSIQGSSTLSRTLTSLPSGPIPGSQDINKRAADAILCPRLYGPEVPGPFAFFCQAPAFKSACQKVGISATIQTLQSTVTVFRTTTAPATVRTITTSVTTIATLNRTVTATTTTTVPVLETQVPFGPAFYLSARGLHLWTGGTTSGSPLVLVSYAANQFAIYSGQDLRLYAGQEPIYVNGGGDYLVRFGFDGVSYRDARKLKCGLSQATTGNLTCISGPPGDLTTRFQYCNNDGRLYHAPTLLTGCDLVRVYTAGPEGTG